MVDAAVHVSAMMEGDGRQSDRTRERGRCNYCGSGRNDRVVRFEKKDYGDRYEFLAVVSEEVVWE